ncbi:tyrosine-type recombinase/integrase [Myxococcota bacterium]|nr:tyrosine-type recombinase/integrase [Myxococcota bacterium]
MNHVSMASHFASADENARFQQFLDWLSARGRSDATARSYRSDWQDLAAWYRRARGAPFDASSLDADTVAAWREAGQNKGKSPATLTRRLAFARTYARWLAEDGVVAGGAMANVQRVETPRTTDERAVRVLSDAEVHRLLQQVEARGCRRDQAILYVLLDTGLKVSELVALELGDVDFSTGRLRVNNPWARSVELPTRAARKVAWSLAERGLLAMPPSGEIELPATGGWPPAARVSYPEPGRIPTVSTLPGSPMPFGLEGPPASWPLFTGERGRLTPNAVQRILRKHAAFARIDDASPHVLRHTFAVSYWLRTRDLVGLAERLGLESLESAKAYAHLSPPVDPMPDRAAVIPARAAG